MLPRISAAPVPVKKMPPPADGPVLLTMRLPITCAPLPASSMPAPEVSATLSRMVFASMTGAPDTDSIPPPDAAWLPVTMLRAIRGDAACM